MWAAVHTESFWAFQKVLVVVKAGERTGHVYKQKVWDRKQIPGAFHVSHGKKERHSQSSCLVGHRVPGPHKAYKVQTLGMGREGQEKGRQGDWGEEERSSPASEPWTWMFADRPSADASLWKLSGPTQTSVGQKLPQEEGKAQLGPGPGRICREQGPWVEQEGSTQRSRRWPLSAIPILG